MSAGAQGNTQTRQTAFLLTAIIALASVMRLYGLDRVPPGINQDEALSAWNGWMLLRTGHAMSGEPWPLFHCRNLGDFPTMLYFYVLMPFQQLFGWTVWSTRIPAALAGIAATWCVFDIGRRAHGAVAGWWAALAFALAPWAVFLGHFGTGASLGPFQAVFPLVLLGRTGLVPALGAGAPRGRAVYAVLCGLALGIGTYGFHSLRLHLPLTLGWVLLVAPGSLVQTLRDRDRRIHLMLILVAFAATFAPLAYVSFADPDSLARWQMTRLWPEGTSLPEIAKLIGQRYALHFSPDFLFLKGDRYSVLNPARTGALAWWMLPLLVVGTGALLWRARRDVGARLLLGLLALYPVGDLMSANDGVHSLRSSAGLPALVLVVGAGGALILQALSALSPTIKRAALALLTVAVLGETWFESARFFQDVPRDRQIQIEYQAALWDAGKLLAPKLSPHTQVFCTTTGMNQPFAILLMAIQMAPASWQAADKDIVHGEFDQYRRVGPFHFIMDETAMAALKQLQANSQADTVYFISRPGEFGQTTPTHVVSSSTGEPMLWVYSEVL